MKQNFRSMESYIPRLGLLLWLLACPSSIYSLGQSQYVKFTASPESMQLVSRKGAAPILVDPQAYPGVMRAARDLQIDIERVTGIKPQFTNGSVMNGSDVVLIGTLGRDRRIDDLISAGKIDVATIRNRWECFLIQVVPDPWPGVVPLAVIGKTSRRGLAGLVPGPRASAGTYRSTPPADARTPGTSLAQPSRSRFPDPC